ncbi:MAG TPA: YfhO family protein [Candidatus Hydrogenedentes bacterium]|nr:YfhO family protein [Candidatus Hydrogenedentota bacterium]HQH51681.1 YfhO family protein [Candidatus Hydrogenedentota bacterium]
MNHDTHHMTWQELLAHALLLLVMVACLFPATFLRGERTIPGALLYEHAPWKYYRPADLTPAKNRNPYEYLSFFVKLHAAEQMAHENAQWPLWNPLESTGVPLLANYQSAVLFPLRIPHWFLDPFTADTVFLLLRLWLCGVTAYLCGRGIGLSAGPSRFFSLAWMMSGICLNWFYWPLPEVLALMPVVVLGAEYLALGRARAGFTTLTVGAILMLLTGHPETAFMGCLGVGAYFFLRVTLEKHPATTFRKTVMLAGGAWALALLVCAPQILPFLEYVRNSNISLDSFQHTISRFSGIPLQTLVCLLIPRFFGISAHETFWLDEADNSNTTAFLYIGAVTWTALALLFARGKLSARMRAQALALAVPSLAGIFFALRSQPVSALNALPVWKYWYATFPLFGLPLLGAFGVQHWLDAKRRLRELAVPLAVLAVPFLLAAGLFLFHKRVLAMQGLSDYVLRQILFAACFAALGMAIAAAACFRVPVRAVAGLLALILAADLVFASRDLLPTIPAAQLYPETKLTTELQAKGHPVRISVLTAGIDSGLMQHYRIEQLHGYDVLYPKRIVEFLEKTYPDDWRKAEPLCSLQYYLFPEGAELDPADLSSLERTGTADGIDIYRSSRAMPRAFLVQSLETVVDPDALFLRMHEESFNPAAAAITDAPVPPFGLDTRPAAPGTAIIEQWTPAKVAVRVDAPARSVLVLTDAYYPGWRAYSDGGETPVFPVYHNFRGVLVDPGVSRIEFRFQPASLRMGLWVSCPVLCLMTVWALCALIRRKRRQVCAP